MKQIIPVVDMFAGPGGLSEGFHQLESQETEFNTVLSFEKESAASKTLLLRSFFRLFHGKPPEAYYRYLRGDGITIDELFILHPEEADKARRIVHQIELGADEEAVLLTDNLLESEIGTSDDWLLIGGPPCQAFSLAGRSRMVGAIGRTEFEKDHRHFLYREYLRIIGKFRPSVFVMENVKGLLSAKHQGESMFQRIIDDLSSPTAALPNSNLTIDDPVHYEVVSLVVPQIVPEFLTPRDFVIEAERHGVPQKRHRVILLGVRTDLNRPHDLVLEQRPSVSVSEVLDDVPPLRSSVSARYKHPCDDRSSESGDASTEKESSWAGIISEMTRAIIDDVEDQRTRDEMLKSLEALNDHLPTGGRFVEGRSKPNALRSWFLDNRLGGFLNHDSRSHMPSDLVRYLFASSFARLHKVSPTLQRFPVRLLPEHKNVLGKNDGKNIQFNDRFRVQLSDQPASTIVSHISKDGHYYIHYDPKQCRSLTVREAARLQTFPDNYFFEGNRTEQYTQVGNAVPPYLAAQIADVVSKIFQANRANENAEIGQGRG